MRFFTVRNSQYSICAFCKQRKPLLVKSNLTGESLCPECITEIKEVMTHGHTKQEV